MVEASAEGMIEGAAWMMTPVCDSAESGSTITVRVLVEVRPAVGGDVGDGVGGGLGRVELDRELVRASVVSGPAEGELPGGTAAGPYDGRTSLFQSAK